MSKLVDLEYEEILIDNDERKAVLFSIDGKTVWLPRSQIEYGDGTVTLPEWLAIEKELV